MKAKTRSTAIFSSRLKAYSATAAAAFLAAPAVEAAVQNITDGAGGNLLINGSHTTLPIFNFGNKSASMQITAGPIQFSFYAFNSASGFATGKLVSGLSPFAAYHEHTTRSNRDFLFPYNIAASATISAQGPFRNSHGGYLIFQGGTSPSNHVEFNPAFGASNHKTGYLGFKATQGTNHYYGWVRLKVTDSAGGFPDQFALVDKSSDGIFGAFGSPSDQIKAGEIATSVPEPPSFDITGLGLLALGAQGIREMRRRRATQKKA